MKKILIFGLILIICAVIAPVNAAPAVFEPQIFFRDFSGASDAGIVPITERNPDINSCADIGLATSIKCEDQSGDTIGGCTAGGFSAVYDSTDLRNISWSANMPVSAVVVKDGAPTGNAYVYHPDDLTSDFGLWTPSPAVGAGSISHVFFCYTPATTTAPEFPVVALPVGMMIGFLGIVLLVRKTKEN